VLLCWFGYFCWLKLKFQDFGDEADGIYSDGHDFLMSADGRTMNYLVMYELVVVLFGLLNMDQWRSLSYPHMCILYLLQILIAYYKTQIAQRQIIYECTYV